MNEGFQFIDIIFFAMLAAFVLLRLRGRLGRRTGHEQRPPNPLERHGSEDGSDNVVALPDRPDEAETSAAADDFADVGDSELAAGLTQVKLADASFDRPLFLEGSRGAFEMVVNAYAAADTDALRALLDDDVYRNFARTIEDRVAAGEVLETVLVSIDDGAIIEAGMKDRTAFVTVRFVSHQINVTHDAEGSVVDGDPTHEVEVTDIWTFERDSRSSNPNWKLVATRSPN